MGKIKLRATDSGIKIRRNVKGITPKDNKIMRLHAHRPRYSVKMLPKLYSTSWGTLTNAAAVAAANPDNLKGCLKHAIEWRDGKAVRKHIS